MKKTIALLLALVMMFALLLLKPPQLSPLPMLSPQGPTSTS